MPCVDLCSVRRQPISARDARYQITNIQKITCEVMGTHKKAGNLIHRQQNHSMALAVKQRPTYQDK